MKQVPDFPACCEETFLFLVDGEAGQKRTLSAIRKLARPGLGCLAYHGGDTTLARLRVLSDAGFVPTAWPQTDAGGRFEHAFFRAFRNGARRVVAVIDGPEGLKPEMLAEAFDSLDGGDAVLGPAGDGGYYLIGLSRPCRSVFRGIPWGSDLVLRETLAHMHGCGFRVRILPPLLAASGV